MIEISIKEAPYYRIKISGDQELLHLLREFFTSTHGIVYQQRNIETEKMEVKRDTEKESLVLENTKNSIVVDKGFFYFVLVYLYQKKKKYPNYFKYNTDVNIKGKIVINKKWRNILRNDQLQAFENLTKYKGSLSQLPTSWGKTELFLAIIESYTDIFPDKNVLITVPRNPIKDEILNRFKKYSFSTKKVYIINPVGYYNSNKVKSKEFNQWLSNVGLIIHDEVHHITDIANSYRFLFNKLPNLEYSYGFSATISGHDLTELNDFKLWDYYIHLKIGMCGPSLVHKFAKDFDKKIISYLVKGKFGEMHPDDELKYHKNVLRQCNNPVFQDCIIKIVRHFGYVVDNRIFYMPIPFKEAGYKIWESLIKIGIPAIHWCGGYKCNPPDYKSLEGIKYAVNNRKCKVLIATSTSNEGVDIGGLTAAINAFGRADTIVPQTVGRSGRRGTPLIFNIMNMEHNLFKSQARARDICLKNNYDCRTEVLNF